MKTIKHYIDKAKELRTTLANNLIDKRVDCSAVETYNTLVPKVETIVGEVKGVINLPNMSLYGCKLSEEEINDLLTHINLTAPGTDISYKFAYIPNLKKLRIADLGITTVSACTGYLTGTSLEELSLEGLTIQTYSVFSTYQSTSGGVATYATALPTTLKTLDLTNVIWDTTSFIITRCPAETIIGFDTIVFNKPLTTLKQALQYCTKLIDIDLSKMLISDTLTSINIEYMCASDAALTSITLPTTLPNKKSIAYCFNGCDSLSWEAISNALDWDNINLSANSFASAFNVSTPAVVGDKMYYDATNYSFKRYIPVLDFSHTGLTTFSRCFDYNHIGELILSNLTFKFTTRFYELLGSYQNYISGSYYIMPYALVEKLTIHDSNITCNTTYNSSSMSGSHVNINFAQTIDLKNVTFTHTSNTASNDFSELFRSIGCEELDLSGVKFIPTASCTSLRIYYLLRYCRKIKKLIGPDLSDITVPISACILTDYRTYLTYYDISKINLGTLSGGSTSYLDPLPAGLEFVSYGEDLGKGFTTTSASASTYSLTTLANCKILQKECVVDLFNKLYDLNVTYDVANGGTLVSQYVDLHADVLAQLTADEILIATNKGWIVK